ncbi:bifunctional DNA primase/polymerase [Streptomyces sp. NPDC059740]|uniref:bifunctional DNA primase/polymerase n=1 Tax=Streptomyces sp. NPDC059740 TaxID=3346926 RepID=UPI003654720E
MRHTTEQHWDVLPGAWWDEDGARPRCSCGAHSCPAPGAHPTAPRWAHQVTASAATARSLWSEHPRASLLLPTGGSFDAVEVSETAGCLALARAERLALPLGPVTLTPDRRMFFLVQPGAGSAMPGLLHGLGWRGAPARTLDLRVHGAGDYIVAPPTRLGGLGQVRWVRHPARTGRRLPDAAEIAAPLAYACGQEQAPDRRL